MLRLPPALVGFVFFSIRTAQALPLLPLPPLPVGLLATPSEAKRHLIAREKAADGGSFVSPFNTDDTFAPSIDPGDADASGSGTSPLLIGLLCAFLIIAMVVVLFFIYRAHMRRQRHRDSLASSTSPLPQDLPSSSPTTSASSLSTRKSDRSSISSITSGARSKPYHSRRPTSSPYRTNPIPPPPRSPKSKKSKPCKHHHRLAPPPSPCQEMIQTSSSPLTVITSPLKSASFPSSSRSIEPSPPTSRHDSTSSASSSVASTSSEASLNTVASDSSLAEQQDPDSPTKEVEPTEKADVKPSA